MGTQGMSSAEWGEVPGDLQDISVQVRFWSHVDSSRAGSCWPWKAALTADGYGFFSMKFVDGATRSRRASRVAWAYGNGRWPDVDEVVRHECDNPICCNPNHLVIGSHRDNMLDRAERKTSRSRGDTHWTRTQPANVRRGSAVGGSKLTEAQVLEIKARYAASGGVRGAQVALAKEYGVSPQMVNMILKGKWWQHV